MAGVSLVTFVKYPAIFVLAVSEVQRTLTLSTYKLDITSTTFPSKMI